jgi:hypothetical protein
MRHTLIFFVNSPVNITGVVASDKYSTLLWPPIGTLPLLESTSHQRCFDGAPAPHISARVERIPENVGDKALRGNLPHQSRTADGVGGQFHIMITKPSKGLPHAPEFSELGKHQTDGFDQDAEPLCRFHLWHTPPGAVSVTHRDVLSILALLAIAA